MRLTNITAWICLVIGLFDGGAALLLRLTGPVDQVIWNYTILSAIWIAALLIVLTIKETRR